MKKIEKKNEKNYRSSWKVVEIQSRKFDWKLYLCHGHVSTVAWFKFSYNGKFDSSSWKIATAPCFKFKTTKKAAKFAVLTAGESHPKCHRSLTLKRMPTRACYATYVPGPASCISTISARNTISWQHSANNPFFYSWNHHFSLAILCDCTIIMSFLFHCKNTAFFIIFLELFFKEKCIF